ncbi:MAG: hypothetical protein M3P08_09225 [Thermoproteota archaeon]|nr:hypothetical protein [Thermoproteota archaeon]
MWLLGQKLGIDANLALQVAVKSAEGFWNPIYGTKGGRPYGGKCLPKDIKSFLSFAKESGCNLSLISAVDSVNSHMTALLHENEEVETENDAITNTAADQQ